MKASSICGSGIRAIYREHLGTGPEAYQGVIAGHEPCGQVVETGPGCRRLSAGNRVVVYHITGCGVCEECRHGCMIGCMSGSRAAHGWQRDGGHAEFLLAEENTCILAVDMAIGHECTAHGLGAASLRYFNVAGAAYAADGRILGERHDPETHLIPLALQVAAGRRQRLQIFGEDYPTPDGTCVRDYIHIEDLATAHLLALDAAAPGRHGIYNLGNGSGFSNRQVVETVREITGAPVPVQAAPRRPGDPAELVASPARARSELGWTPAKPGLRDIVADAWAFARSPDTPD